MRAAISFVILGGACLAQVPGVPGLGWISTEAPGRYERVVGVGGAAQTAGAVELVPAKLLAVRPCKPEAAMVDGEGRVALQQFDAGGDSVLLPLEGAVENPFLLNWSPSGDALLLAGGSRVQVWRVDENGAAALLRELPLAVESAALSDGGNRLLARIEGVLFLLDEDQSMRELSRGAAAFTFLAGGGRFAWIEGRTLRIGGADAAVEPVELEELGETGARLLASAGNGKLLSAESSAGGTVVRLWSGEGQLEGEWRCPAEVAAINATGVAGVLHLAARDAGPAWMADLGAVQPSVFFVPRPAEFERQGGDQ